MRDPDALGRALATFDWAATTPSLALLDYSVTMCSTEPDLVEALAELYGALVSAAPARHVLSIVGHGSASSRTFSVHRDATELLVTPSAAVALAHLLWDANRQAIDHIEGSVVIHAAAATRDGRAIVIPGAMGAGKSTLVAGLVERGFDYLTDEIVAVERASGLVRAYPKYLSLHTSARALLPKLSAATPTPPSLLGLDQWLVPPLALDAPVVGAACRPGVVLATRYEPGASTVLERMSPAEALYELAQHSYHLDGDAASVLGVLAEMVHGSRCARLVSGDLAEACARVEDLIAETTTGAWA